MVVWCGQEFLSRAVEVSIQQFSQCLWCVKGGDLMGSV
jgi:hypothetical protein